MCVVLRFLVGSCLPGASGRAGVLGLESSAGESSAGDDVCGASLCVCASARAVRSASW